MIPILYDKTETAFTSNGIGRLRDCISCVCSEERNGVYEVDFQYPVDGANYELIQVGRIIGVTHDESSDIQPFDIVSFTKPIDGVVTFHCVHISYRQSYLTFTSSNVNSLTDAFTALGTAEPSNPFSYWTDKSSSGYCGCMDGTPRTVRQALGGIEGSILDAYGGEYEWDRWQVKLWSARGQYRDFSIRYGVNMLDYNEEYDSSGCYSSCIPYWTDGTTTVVGDKQTNGGVNPSGREQCIPLDVSEKFEDQPTKAQVEAMGLQVMNSANPTVPSQNITVSFVRLQDMGEFADFQNLLQCKLCDTIKVIFPDFNSSGTFKIVKTVWNVLRGKYDEMELGDLSISLSEALGITDYQSTSKSTIEQIQTEVNDCDKRTLLWTNSDPSSVFAPQDVAISAAYNIYDFLEIEYVATTSQDTTTGYKMVNRFPCKASAVASMVMYTNAWYILHRSNWWTANGLHFDYGYYNSMTNPATNGQGNDNLIPYKIYGLKK